MLRLRRRGDAVAHPVLLAHDLAVELVLGHLLLGQLLVAPGLEVAKADVDAPRRAAVEPHRRLRQVLQEAAVVADEHEGAALVGQARFEPFDGRQVEVVGRLVEQQDVGRRRQHVGERRAAQLAARQGRRVLLAAEAQLLQQIAGLMRIVGGAEAGFHVGQRGGVAGEVGLLRQVAHGGARLHEALAPVGLDQARGDPEQRRLARAVAPDQAHPLPRRHSELRPLQQRRAAKGELDVAELEKGRGGCHCRRCIAPSRRDVCAAARGGAQRAGWTRRWWARQGSNL